MERPKNMQTKGQQQKFKKMGLVWCPDGARSPSDDMAPKTTCDQRPSSKETLSGVPWAAGAACLCSSTSLFDDLDGVEYRADVRRQKVASNSKTLKNSIRRQVRHREERGTSKNVVE